jgi:hypothetical protein
MKQKNSNDRQQEKGIILTRIRQGKRDSANGTEYEQIRLLLIKSENKCNSRKKQEVAN